MPKPLFGDNGSGMHCHQSLWKGGTPLFFDKDGYGPHLGDGPALYRRSDRARPGAAGHLCPDDQQLPPPGSRLRGSGQPHVSARNRSAICRIPMYSESPKSKRVEFRAPDPSANPYLAFAAM